MFKDTKHTAFTLILNAMLLVLNIFFPVNPGPVFLGDFLVSLNLFILLFTFYFKTSKQDDYQSEINKKNTLGYFTLGVCFIHLIFPGFVIL